MGRFLPMLLVLSASISAQSLLTIKSSYSNLLYKDLVSSSSVYTGGLTGFKIGGEKRDESSYHYLGLDASLGLGIANFQEEVSDSPFLIDAGLEYAYNFNILKSDVSSIYLGPGISYSLKGIIPGSLSSILLSWEQLVSLSLAIYSEINFKTSYLSLFFTLPITGFYNRPSWTGVFDKTIIDLSADGYQNILLKNNSFYFIGDVIRPTLSIEYRWDLDLSKELILGNRLYYSLITVPRRSETLNYIAYFGFSLKLSN